MSGITLWDYPKSSASYRVRIALNLAGLDYRIETVDLLEGAQNSVAHLARNPQGLVPVLDIDGHRFTQSLAILEYLSQTRGLGLLPADPAEAAKVRALAHSLAIDVHPICNLSVMTHATGGTEPARTDWMHHFIAPGLRAFETLLEQFEQNPFATGKTLGLADVCLIPQLFNARRWSVIYEDCPKIIQIESVCQKLDAFQNAAPPT